MPPETKSREVNILWATLEKAAYENQRLRQGRRLDGIIIVLLVLVLLVASWKLGQ